MNATEILWQAARVGEKRALPILSFPAAKALGIPVDEMARSAELQAKAVFHASRLPTAAAVSPARGRNMAFFISVSFPRQQANSPSKPSTGAMSR